MKNEKEISGYNFFCSWSGGKDSCLSLFRMIKAGNNCSSLVTMLDETGLQSRSHGLTPEALQIQAEAMGIQIKTAITTWGNYEINFKMLISQLKEENLADGVFGDIDLEPHRVWVERVCKESGITPHLPLWKENRRNLVEEFIREGFKSLIVVVNSTMMPERYLGRLIDSELIEELETKGVDACGENGEFHTFVFDGPLFKRKFKYITNEITHFGNYAFLPITASFA